jgi:Ca2+-binding RTX toxin-like protein
VGVAQCALVLIVALAAACPFAAVASTAAVEPGPVMRLVVTPGPNDGANDVSISSSADRLQFLVTDLGTAISAGTNCLQLDASHVSCDATGVRAIRVMLGDENDKLTIGDLAYPANPPTGESPVFANGEAGDDTLLGGEGRDDLRGGVGDDPMIGGGGGDDQIGGSEGSDTLDGGPGSRARCRVGRETTMSTVAQATIAR